MAIGPESTTFTRDVLGRFILNTWDEATSDSAGIDVVVLGAGLYGGYCASKIYQLSRAALGPSYARGRFDALRVLVLDAGPFVLPEHTANIPDLGFYDPGIGSPAYVGAGANPAGRNEVWGVGWRSNQAFVGQAYCVGGKGLFWGGWCPELQPVDLAEWPEEVRDYLASVPVADPALRPITHTDPVSGAILHRGDPLTGYQSTEYEIGVSPSDQFVFDPVQISGPGPKKVGLNEALRVFLDQQRATIDPRITKILPSPIAVQTQSFISGLFSIDKYSSLPALTAAARDDHGDGRPQDLRFAVVPNCHVTGLGFMPDPEALERGTRIIDHIDVRVAGEPRSLPIEPHCQVVLAMSCIESTRLALECFPLVGSGLRQAGGELIGRNYMIHLRFDIAFDIDRAQFASWVAQRWPGFQLAEDLQQAAIHLQCEGQHGTYQYQFYALTNSNGPEDNMYRMVPDLSIRALIAKGFQSDKIRIVMRASGEVKGGRSQPVGNPGFDYIDLAGEADRDAEFGHRRAWVQFNRGDHGDDAIWTEMHDTGHAIARQLAGNGPLEYKNNIQGHADYSLGAVKRQQGMGTTFHDAGTLWMGSDPDMSVTDVNGHFHHVTNAYCADQGLFTTVGSANPVLTGLTLARKVAEDIVSRHVGHATNAPAPPPAGRRSLLPTAGWRSAPYDGVVVIDAARDGLIETDPHSGIGLYYLPQTFGDLNLSVEWKAFRTYRGRNTVANAGILLRIPDPSGVDFADGRSFEDFYRQSIEVQIDESGKRFSPETRQAVFGDSRYKTGAVYGLAPARQWASCLASPDGGKSGEHYWNRYDIALRGNSIAVRLNGRNVCEADLAGTGKRRDGFVALQFHTGRVQFRNLSLS